MRQFITGPPFPCDDGNCQEESKLRAAAMVRSGSTPGSCRIGQQRLEDARPGRIPPVFGPRHRIGRDDSYLTAVL
jgi:hypothetical protein